ncbi:Kef-type potassium/proton antiporter accessory protein, CPA2 family [Chitinophaga costaii]|uniref:Kef-type potassium/proton antiporter accessory protein, CPA2 family n=1 Tax=Chitinophaga costaii TaxID=1335309 RepID=A0A1C4G210_9BACT|nr:NAD(P)H-dependent oxidoreductase [Chitinophaga costaii]PUZ19951.1 NAD(P)H oxidoreductase [Chitinophaga costaii]SCC61801.1 Kef-type potassium/proton antiporter accessory protein, CPA2 family [Chitinophaga costaii]
MKKILILFAHPVYERSRAQKVLATAAQQVQGVTFRDLYERYPDFDVDVQKEQQLLQVHDIIILQHPLYWYSMPALLKQWIDLVLVHGWAYGHEGHALDGKLFLQALSAGTQQQSYAVGEAHNHPLREFLYPIEQTAKICRMQYLPPFVVHGVHHIAEPELLAWGEKFKRALLLLQQSKFTPAVWQQAQYLNDLL